jgi:hypothetical protein
LETHRDPFFPLGHGEALAREIPGARLLVLERQRTRCGSCFSAKSSSD